MFTFGDGVVLGHPAGHDGVLAQPVNVGQCSDPLKNIGRSTGCPCSVLQCLPTSDPLKKHQLFRTVTFLSPLISPISLAPLGAAEKQ
jgi:hypothetical protein